MSDDPNKPAFKDESKTPTYLAQAKEREELRDRFACAVLTGMISKSGYADYEAQARLYAEYAYTMASAMLAQREKKG